MFLLILLAGDIATNPGPVATKYYNIQCLYFNARGLLNRTSELQTMVTDIDLLAVTETWPEPGLSLKDWTVKFFMGTVSTSTDEIELTGLEVVFYWLYVKTSLA